ncbi:hypothetical protein PIB30_082411, partial [Stylosanthes scabra]|nr:hypothetical protein [Stylosanthes scabra]
NWEQSRSKANYRQKQNTGNKTMMMRGRTRNQLSRSLVETKHREAEYREQIVDRSRTQGDRTTVKQIGKTMTTARQRINVITRRRGGEVSGEKRVREGL